MLGLELGQNLAWDLNKTHSPPTEITDLVSGPKEVQVLDVSSQKKFSERQSDRQEVDIFRKKHSPQSVGHHRVRVTAPKCSVVSFYGLGNFIS